MDSLSQLAHQSGTSACNSDTNQKPIYGGWRQRGVHCRQRTGCDLIDAQRSRRRSWWPFRRSVSLTRVGLPPAPPATYSSFFVRASRPTMPPRRRRGKTEPEADDSSGDEYGRVKKPVRRSATRGKGKKGGIFSKVPIDVLYEVSV